MTSTIQETTPGSGVNGAPRHGEQLEGAATGLLNQAARTADAQASTTMTKVGQTLEGVAKAIDDAASGLRESQPEIANFADTASQQVAGAATYLRDHTASEALDQVQQVARRQPMLVVGGGLALGLVLGRLLRTGAAVAQSDMQSGGSQRQLGAGYSAGGYGTAGTSGSDYASDAAYGATAYGASAYGATPADELAATDAAVDEVELIDVEVDVEPAGTRGQGR